MCVLGGTDEAGQPFPVRRNHSPVVLSTVQTSQPSQGVHGDSLPCLMVHLPFCTHVSTRTWALGGTALRPSCLLYPPNPPFLRAQGKIPLTLDDFGNRQPECSSQAPLSHLMERVARPRPFPKVRTHSSCLPTHLSLRVWLTQSGALWRLPVRVPEPGLLRRGLYLHCE